MQFKEVLQKIEVIEIVR